MVWSQKGKSNTIEEVVAIVIVLLCLIKIEVPYIGGEFQNIRSVIEFWGISFFIYVFSQENGLFSYWLGNIDIPDISFEMYLIHYVLLEKVGINHLLTIWIQDNVFKLAIGIIGSFVVIVLLSIGWQNVIGFINKKWLT